MEVPGLGVQLELQLPTYTTAMSDLSHICNLHPSSRQLRILNPLSEAGDRTRNLLVPSFRCAMMGSLQQAFLPIAGGSEIGTTNWEHVFVFYFKGEHT